MTLVFAHIAADRIEVYSDTQISHGSGVRPDLIPGMLKALVLRPDLCVAYAGPPDLALASIRVAMHALTHYATLTNVTQLLLDEHNRLDQAVEFIVASLDGKPRLERIANGALSRDAMQYWIGDASAARRLAELEQECPYSVGDISEEHRRSTRLSWAFSQLTNDRFVDSVGGLSMCVRTYAGGFNYVSSIMAFAPPQELGPGESTISFGTAANGGYAYSLLAPSSPGVAVVAAYFVQGRFGYVYAPLQLEHPRLYRGVSHELLVLLVRAHFDIEVNAPMLS